MMEVYGQFSDNKFEQMVHRFAAYQRKSAGEIIRSQARLMCVNLAHNTQPYGADDSAKFKGQNAVRGDLSKVFIGSDRVHEIARIGAQSGKDVSRRLLAAVDARNNEGVRTAWQQLTGRAIAVETAPNAGWHQSQRNKRGRVRRSATPMIVMSETALKSYRLTKEKLVGFGKSGWATCARLLGGTRGIPGWVSRNRGPGSIKDMTKDPDNPKVIMTNSVRYIRQILPESEMVKAFEMQQGKMEMALKRQFYADARRAFKSA